jgi:hypothetical protein
MSVTRTITRTIQGDDPCKIYPSHDHSDVHGGWWRTYDDYQDPQQTRPSRRQERHQHDEKTPRTL